MHVTTQMNFEDNIQSKSSQSLKATNRMIVYMKYPDKVNVQRQKADKQFQGVQTMGKDHLSVISLKSDEYILELENTINTTV